MKVILLVVALSTQHKVTDDFYWCYYVASTPTLRITFFFPWMRVELASEARNSVEYVLSHLTLGIFVMLIVC